MGLDFAHNLVKGNNLNILLLSNLDKLIYQLSHSCTNFTYHLYQAHRVGSLWLVQVGAGRLRGWLHIYRKIVTS